MTNLYKSFHHCIELPKFYRSTEAYHEESSSALPRLSKPIDESIQKLLQNASVEDAERSSSISTMRETTKESAVSGSDSIMHSLQEVPPFGSINESSRKEVSGVNLLKEFVPASNTTNRAVGSYSDDDDGSIASRVLSLSSKCKSSSIFGSPSRSENTHEKNPKIRGVKFEYCTEGLGSESSDWSISSLGSNVGKRGISENGRSTTIGGVEDDSNLPISVDEEKENWAPKTNWGCASSERVKAWKCTTKFPPPLSTLTRTRYPHLPNAPLVFLRPLKMDGRFVLQEVRAPCRDFLQASRKDGRLRLEIVRHIDDVNFGRSSCESWQESEEEERVHGEEVVDESPRIKDERTIGSCVEKTDVKIEAKKRKMKDDICSSMSDSNTSEEMQRIGQEVRFQKSERMNNEETKDTNQNAMSFAECRNLTGNLQMKNGEALNLFSSVGRDQNLSKISGSLPSHKVERNMSKKQQDLGRCDASILKLEFINCTLQESMERKKGLNSSLMAIEKAKFIAAPPELLKVEDEEQQTKDRQGEPLKQDLGKRGAECYSRLPVIRATKSSSMSKMFGSIESSDIRNDTWCGRAKEQEGIANLSAAKGGVDEDACTNFSRTHSMPVLFPFPTALSSALSLSQMQAAIISNAEALHISCKKGLDGNNWKKGVAPFVGVPLRC